MLIGIDLLWVRPGICGGTESYIRNLLTGFGTYDSENQYVLFTAQDNADTFEAYREYGNFSLVICPVDCAKQEKRILWENLHLDRYAKKHNIELMFIPVYSKPISWGSKIAYVTVIHDLQALHYPEYFSKLRNAFFRLEWWYATKASKHIVAISDYGKGDLIKRYPWVADRISTIYDPIISQKSEVDFDKLTRKYHVQSGQYYYCVSSMLPHKNLKTILEVVALFKRQGRNIPLVVSGVGGNAENFWDRVNQLDIADMVINTGFVSDEERDCLYENCKLFLFPSIFEGFGMPPVEAMRKGKRVVMTKKACLYEVSDRQAVYVDDPYDLNEWVERINYAERQPERVLEFEQYSLKVISEKFIELFRRVFEK